MKSVPRVLAGALVVALIAVMVLATVPRIPFASAQSISIGGYDTTYGWTFPDGESPGAELTDGTDDIVLNSTAPAPIPVAAEPFFSSADLTRIRLDEVDGEMLLLGVEVAALDPQVTGASSVFGLMSSDYDVLFSVGGRDYALNTYFSPACTPNGALCEPVTQPSLAAYSTLFLETPEGLDVIGDVPTRVVDNTIQHILPRYAFDRTGPGLHPLAGDALTIDSVTAQIGFCLIGGNVDVCWHAQDDIDTTASAASFYTLGTDTFGSLVALDAVRPPEDETDDDDDGDTPEPRDEFDGGPLLPRRLVIDVDPTHGTRMPLAITNHQRSKALIAPSATVASSHSGVTFTLPESIEVPPGETRTIMVGINLTGPIDPADPLRINMGVQTLATATPTGDRVLVLVRAVPTLGPQAPRLYFHTYGEDFTGLAEHTTMFTYSEAVLNTLADDPLDNGYGSTLSWSCLCSDAAWGWTSTGTTLNKLHIDPEQTAILHLDTEAPTAGVLHLDAFLVYDEATVASGSKSVEISQGAAVIEIPLTIEDDAATLPPGSSFWLALESTFRPVADVPLGELAALAQPIDPRLNTQGKSWLEVPFVAPADRYDGASHLIPDLARGYELVQYVNPGRSTLWNVTILNQADTEDKVRVDAASTSAGWTTVVQPGRTYVIPPGGSVTVGILATAPANAGEGNATRVNVTIVSDVAQGAKSGLSLSAVVTDGVEIEEGVYAADNETASALRIDRDEKGSPGPSLLVGILGMLGVACARRRSR